MHYYLTWTVFWLVLAGLLLAWYVLIIACYYRREVTLLFTTILRPQGNLPSSGSQLVMGRARADENEMSLVDSDQLDFALEEDELPESAAEVRADKNKLLLLGGLADFMQELKTLIQVTIESESDRETFLNLFQLLASKYGQLMDGSFSESICSYVTDSDLPFKISGPQLKEILTHSFLNED